MIYGDIYRQRLELANEYTAADTMDYLEMKFNFRTDDWDGLTKWAHFAKDDTVFSVCLTDDRIRREDHLNLSAGEWKVYLHGNRFEDGKVVCRVTTGTAALKVEPTGTLDGEPFPEIPSSETERIYARLARLESGGVSGGGGGMIYEIGTGLILTEGVLSAETGKESFVEIPEEKVQGIFNKVMED